MVTTRARAAISTYQPNNTTSCSLNKLFLLAIILNSDLYKVQPDPLLQAA